LGSLGELVHRHADRLFDFPALAAHLDRNGLFCVALPPVFPIQATGRTLNLMQFPEVVPNDFERVYVRGDRGMKVLDESDRPASVRLEGGVVVVRRPLFCVPGPLRLGAAGVARPLGDPGAPAQDRRFDWRSAWRLGRTIST
jgi:hypothetical protein